MLSDRDLQWQKDIIENIDLVEDFVAGLNFEAFRKETKARYAVLYGLLVISEAARRLSDDTKSNFPDVPWQDIGSAGNIFRHEYHSLNDEIIWKTVREGLPELRAHLGTM